jgi:hypothetical protein
MFARRPKLLSFILAAAIGACCKRDGMWTTWCPDQSPTTGGTGGTPCWVFEQPKYIDPSCDCASATGVYYANSATVDRTVTFKQTVVANGSSSTTSFTRVISNGFPFFAGCTTISSAGTHDCAVRQSWTISSCAAVAGYERHNELFMASAVSTPPVLDCPKLCKAYDPTCYSMPASSTKAVNQVPQLVNFIDPILRNASATAITSTDLLKALGVTKDPCNRNNTLIAGTTLTNTGPDCGMVYDDQIVLFLPATLVGDRSVVNQRVQVSFPTPTNAPRVDARTAGLGPWLGSVTNVVVSKNEKAAWAQVGTGCVEVTW